MDKKISIIIPAYNIEKHLPHCLNSILAQTYKNLEVIVVNDGSRDGTGAVADAYGVKDSRVRVIHKENGGVTSARLRGVAEATGECIGFVDGDDYVEPEMYALLMKNLQEYDADISHCGYQMVFPSRVDYYYNTGRLVLQEGEQGCADLLNGSFVEPALWNKLYRKTLFSGLAEWMDASIRINEDLLMNFYLFRQTNKAVFEDVCLYHYTLRQGSTMVSQLNAHKLRDPVHVMHILLDETEGQLQWKDIIRRRLVYLLISNATLSLSQQRDLIPVRRESRQELRRRLAHTLTSKTFDAKLKIMALWAAIWPWSYCMVHKLYARIRGTDKKFEVK